MSVRDMILEMVFLTTFLAAITTLCILAQISTLTTVSMIVLVGISYGITLRLRSGAQHTDKHLKVQ
ncbi:MAG: hypothetical protein ACOYL5_11970 [Phototrophicaceae bacterium]|jgi:hypothetical protein